MSKNKKRQKRKFISFLMIPGDYDEPINIRLSMLSVKILMVAAAILLFHIIGGGIFYFLYFDAHKRNVKLQAKNYQLETENKQIYRIATKAEEVENILRKLKVSLGIDITADSESALATVDDEMFNSVPDVKRDYEPIRNFEFQDNTVQEPPFLKVENRQTTFHSVFENLPTYLPVDGFITRRFEKAIFSKPLSSYQHLGIDISAKTGTPVKAAGAGLIVFADWTMGMGNLIVLYHGDGLFTYYAHNMSILRQSGYVKKGEPIALLGSSGETSYGPHLHFEIWRNGKPIDPKEYIFSLQYSKSG